MRSRNWTTDQFVFLSLLLINRCCFVTVLAKIIFSPRCRLFVADICYVLIIL